MDNFVKKWLKGRRSNGLCILVLLFVFACGILMGWRLLPSYPASLSQRSQVPADTAAYEWEEDGIRCDFLPYIKCAEEARDNDDYQKAIEYYRRAFGFWLNEAGHLLGKQCMSLQEEGDVNGAVKVTQQAIDLLDGWYDYSYYDHPLQVEFFVLMRVWLLAARDNVNRETILKKWTARDDIVGVMAEYILARGILSRLPKAEQLTNLAAFVAKHRQGYWVGEALVDMAWIHVEEGDLAEARRLFEKALPHIGLGQRALLQSGLEEEGGLEKLQEEIQQHELSSIEKQ